MTLAPKKLKMRKPHRPDVRGVAGRNNAIAFGKFGLKATTGGWVSAAQIEASRRVITKFLKRGGKIWIRIFPHRPITEKGTQATMGGGKGAPGYYVAVVKPGTMIFEIEGISEADARQAMKLTSYKLPVKTTFIVKD
ncbi:50S ribosomal protein L16 [Candidatus Falkowbacteria bacterium]|uniref:Large ribosomal subunit protein uL16 n=1 Tax=Candidatus Buchananbacteria bacterium CG10_big_fil_rev_8_21_14_0_10_33_19 TaxID=1974525 RepID=A0A2H0W562_9BACT|nr:50S ribosomal protein L16 [Candidatus Falkowbacteria bacterium]PIS05731.1 MAG: 50S ribosomal protein L16 [Candidatus Buchananbacteria bacterium CG10_big_fil_rev_8_21_14_0_10_33_19]